MIYRVWDFPEVICSCGRGQDSFRRHLLQNVSSARADKTEKTTMTSNPITANIRLISFIVLPPRSYDFLKAWVQYTTGSVSKAYRGREPPNGIRG